MRKLRIRGMATVNFPYIQRKVVVSNRQVKPSSNGSYLEIGKAFHNGKWWEVYRNTKTGQWSSWKVLEGAE